MAVLYKQNYMTSVLAVRQKAWMVFFIGTEDGQLIKVCINTLNTKSFMIIVIYIYIYIINISQEALYSNRLPDRRLFHAELHFHQTLRVSQQCRGLSFDPPANVRAGHMTAGG